jgi:CRISPR-associated protein Csm1
LCFLDTVIGWEEFNDAIKLRETIQQISEKTQSQALIDKLRQVVISVQEIEQQYKQGKIVELIYWDKWRWRLVYSLKRMERRYPEIKDELDELLQKLITPQSIPNKQTVMDWLQLSVRWAEFLMRSKTND